MNSYEELKIVFPEVTFQWNFEGHGVVQQAAKAKNGILGRRNGTGKIQVYKMIPCIYQSKCQQEYSNEENSGKV